MNTPLTPARLSEIRARVDGTGQSLQASAAVAVIAPRMNGKTNAQKVIASALDVPDLLAEVDRLTAALASEHTKTAAAEATIAQAPHEKTCFIHSHRPVARYCNCWKAHVSTAAFDAALAEARAGALDEALEIMRHLVGYRNAIELKNRAAEIREAQK